MPNRKSLLDWIFPNKSIASSHVIQTCVISVRYYGVAHALELLHVVHHLRSEESGSVLKCRFIYYNSSPFRLHTLHYALYGALAEIVTVRFHCQSVHTYGHVPLVAHVPLRVGRVVSRHFQYLVRYEVLSRAVRFHYSLYQIFRHVLIVRKQLLNLFPSDMQLYSLTLSIQEFLCILHH